PTETQITESLPIETQQTEFQTFDQINDQKVKLDITPVLPDNANVPTENQQTIFDRPDISIDSSSEKNNSSDETFSSDILMTNESADSSKDEKGKKRTYKKRKSSSQDLSKIQTLSEIKKLQQEKPR
ncbi:MAG: hypothetical protein Q4C95_06645, partial [Planctomycetia bacterium]|nr:hypothetical protein [Planctomycetia bacterium]